VACEIPAAVASAGWLVLVAGLVLLAVVGAGWVAIGPPPAAPVPETTVVLESRPGDTLWDVAARMAPAASPSAVVDRIRQLNGMADASVYPGELLVVPAEVGAGG